MTLRVPISTSKQGEKISRRVRWHRRLDRPLTTHAWIDHPASIWLFRSQQRATIASPPVLRLMSLTFSPTTWREHEFARRVAIVSATEPGESYVLAVIARRWSAFIGACTPRDRDARDKESRDNARRGDFALGDREVLNLRVADPGRARKIKRAPGRPITSIRL